MGRQFIQNYYCFAQILEEEELELKKRRKEEETMAKEEKKGLTNADRIRHMTDKELADFIDCPYMKDPYDECIYGWHEHDCDKCKLEWLQSIRKER